MGAESSVGMIKGSTPQAAYNAACQEARYEYGSSYTGTIAESSGYFMHTNSPMLTWEAEAEASRLIDTDGVKKWGPTALIPVSTAASTRQVKLTVDTTGMEYRQENAAILAAIRKMLRAGESIESVHTTTDEKTKIVTTAAEGGTTIVWFVKQSGGRTLSQHPTLTEAKAAAKAALEQGAWTDSLYITKQVAKGGVAAWVHMKRETVKSTTTVTAMVGKPKGGPVTAWVTAGVYSS